MSEHTMLIVFLVIFTPLLQTALKAIIAKLMKAPEAEYFLYPVDARYKGLLPFP
jgi:hypothetical protein